jgi:hypothetical protein
LQKATGVLHFYYISTLYCLIFENSSAYLTLYVKENDSVVTMAAGAYAGHPAVCAMSPLAKYLTCHIIRNAAQPTYDLRLNGDVERIPFKLGQNIHET